MIYQENGDFPTRFIETTMALWTSRSQPGSPNEAGRNQDTSWCVGAPELPQIWLPLAIGAMEPPKKDIHLGKL